jgi:hypothetical protein
MWWTIGRKLNVCFAALRIFSLVLAYTAISAVGSMATNTEQILSRTAGTRYVATKLAATAAEMTSIETGILLRALQRDRTQKEYAKQFTAALASLDSQAKVLGSLVQGTEDRKDLGQILAGVDTVRVLNDRFVELIAQIKYTEAGRFQRSQSLPKRRRSSRLPTVWRTGNRKFSQNRCKPRPQVPQERAFSPSPCWLWL